MTSPFDAKPAVLRCGRCGTYVDWSETRHAAPIHVAEMNGQIAGALAYRLVEAGLHSVALATDPTWQRSGVGGYLDAEADLLARSLNIPRVIVPMTNDNLPSLYFYQRRGYFVSDWITNGVAKHSKSASLIGFGGISDPRRSSSEKKRSRK